MFKLYHSNDLDVLKELLVHQMKQGDSDPFIAEQILVQSQGMAHWLKLQISESLGIAANIEFPLPSSFVWKIYNSVKPDLPERSHFEKEAMTWKLMRLLPTLLDEELFAPIAHYLMPKTAGDSISQQKVFSLAEKIADTFDQYLVYRPDWILGWEEGKDDIEDGDVSSQPWQPELWRRLVADSERLGHSLYHRARLTDQLVDIVQQGHKGLQNLLPTSSSDKPARIFVFGIAALPGTYWQVLNAISEYVDVHFFLLNPCRNYWGDIVNEKTRAKLLQKDAALADYFTVGNPLLASWGKLGRDFVTLVHESANDSGREVNFQDVEAFVDLSAGSTQNGQRSANTVLKNIQLDFLELQNRSDAAFGSKALNNSHAKLPIACNDHSIQIVSAHSPLREVQTLFDQMLGWFDNDFSSNTYSTDDLEGNLKPRDILVMVPDIDVYAPYIEAVFGSAADDQRIPWAIADQALNKENLIIDSFLRLLQLPSSRLTIADVIELLEVPAISQKFEIDLSDLDQVKQWLTKANIRWGLDENHRRNLGLPSWNENTWFKGLQQLLLGLVMPDSAQALNQYWPVASVTGGQGELLGKLMAFIDQLNHWYNCLSEHSENALNPRDWQTLLLQMLSDFYPQQALDDKGLNDQLVLQKIRDQFQRWQEELLLAGYSISNQDSDPDVNLDELTHGVVLQYFTACLTKQVGWQRFLAGPVNFCTLMPMRSIPFKIVCMLGMNDEDYPRRVPPQGFDLMAQGQYRRGDRSRREDDRYLFLEAVIAAQQKLYISYRGRDSRENTEVQPCVLVSELVDYLANGYVLEGDEDLPHKESEKRLRNSLITEQKLQPFNTDYFTPKKPYDLSYQRLWQQVAKASTEADKALDSTELSHSVSNSFLTSPLEDNRDNQYRLTPDLEDMKRCLMNPCQFFMQRRLNVNLTQYWDETEVDEPFELDNLQSYLLNESFLKTLLESNQKFTVDIFKQQQKSMGHLPAANFSDYLLNKSEHQIVPLAESIQEILPSLEKLPPQSHSVVVGEYQLTGQLEHLIDQDGCYQVFHFRTGRFNAKHIMPLWLEHLFACACSSKAGYTMGNSIGLGINKAIKGKPAEVERCEFSPVSPELAQGYLLELIEFMTQCYQQPLAFFLVLAMDYLTAEEEKQITVLEKSQDSEFGDIQNECVQRCFGDEINADLVGFLLAHTSLWQRVLSPLLDHKLSDETKKGESK